MEIKKYEGSLSLTDFAEGLIGSRYGCKTLGEVWENCVKCNVCEHQTKCQALVDEYPNIRCRDVINVLLGDLKLEDVKSN